MAVRSLQKGMPLTSVVLVEVRCPEHGEHKQDLDAEDQK